MKTVYKWWAGLLLVMVVLQVGFAGYGAFFLAMAFGHIVLFRYAMWPEITRKDATLHFWN